jgi:hypothetical protein
MPVFDKVVAGIVLAGLGGAIAIRARLAWRDFRLQQRELRLMVESAEILEEKPSRESAR